ncbi:MAG: cupredoxin domain-containing protein [Gammaproteobacteria bacterium]
MASRRTAIAVIIGLLFSLGVQANGLRGQVTLVDPAGETEHNDITDAVVFFKPDAPMHVLSHTADASMSMQDKILHPHVLAVTVGSTVNFPNDDPILHNVFSTSPGDQFDLGLYRNGVSKSATFNQGGLVRVFCNVHREMYGYILVLDTPYFVRVQPDGHFDLQGLPAGPGELVVWHPRTPVWRQHVAVSDTTPLDIKLHVVRTGVPAHFNKFGQPYKNHPDSGY